MEEIAENIFKPVIRLIIGFFRVLLFIGWDLLVEYVGWSVGWFFYRLVSFGKFPKESFTELDEAPLTVALFIELSGLAILASLIFLLSQLV